MRSIHFVFIVVTTSILSFVFIEAFPAEVDFDVDSYLKQYHYLGSEVPDKEIADLADSNMTRAREIALTMYQMMWDLPVTGKPDEATVRMMKTPRCGMPDINRMADIPDVPGMPVNHKHRHQEHRHNEDKIGRYVLQGSKWPKHSLTYKIIRYSRDLSQEDIDDTISRAFRVWSDVTPLTFTKVSYYEAADIVIQFKDVYDYGYDFDYRQGGVLAYAYFPQYGGDAHFDDAEVWTINRNEGTNLFQIAAHEFGHALGLSHSYDRSALMFPYYLGYVPNFSLPYDDIYGIQAMYGPRQEPTQRPVPTPSYPATPPPDAPNFCYDATFDAVTTQKIGGKVFTIAFRGKWYMALDSDGIVQGYPRTIASGWSGLDVDHIDAALTQPWEMFNGEWRYLSVTYLFAGDYYYKFVNMRMEGGGKVIRDDLGLPGDLDSVFQWYKDGRIYAIKGDQVYALGSLLQGYPDEGYPRPLSSLTTSVAHVDAAFLSLQGATYFFTNNQHVKFTAGTFEAEEGYPRSNARAWLNC